MIAWQEDIVRQLIEAGQNGVPQTELLKNARNLTSSNEATMFLESLRVEHAVQRFALGGPVYWRATELIYDVV